MRRLHTILLTFFLAACASTDQSLVSSTAAQKVGFSSISICAPRFRLGNFSSSPSLYVNGSRIGKPTRSNVVTAELEQHDEWEIAYRPSRLEDPLAINHFIVASGVVTSRENLYFNLDAVTNWERLGDFGLGKISPLGTAILDASGGALNSANDYAGPFTVKSITDSEFLSGCGVD